MREILFRGQDAVTREWIYGCYVDNRDRGRCPPIIVPKNGNPHIYVVPETVGQFTGLTDKNGKKIFEGDILQGDDDIEDDVFHVARIGQSNENRYECFLDFNGDNKCWMPFISYFNRMEIIGNIHDNPEMLT